MLRTFLLLALALTATIALLAQPQSSPLCTPPSVPNITGRGCHVPTADEVRQQKQMQKDRAHQRYLDMQRDSARLLELATQLKKEVDSAGQETLSVDVIKKAESIEKLAKSVKERMKTVD